MSPTLPVGANDQDRGRVVPIFDGEGDLTKWKFMVRSALISSNFPEEEVLSFIALMADNESVHPPKGLNLKLYSIVTGAVRGQALDTVMEIEVGDGLETLRALERRFQPKRTCNKHRLLAEFFGLQRAEGEEVDHLFSRFNSLVQQLRLNKIEMPEDVLAYVLLTSVKDRTLKMIFAGLEDPKMEDLQRLIREAEVEWEVGASTRGTGSGKREKSPGENAYDEQGRKTALALRKRKACFKCGAYDHLIEWCPLRRKELGKTSKTPKETGWDNEVAFSAAEMVRPYTSRKSFLVDSGASVHLCSEPSLFTRWTRKETILHLASSQTIKSYWSGTVKFKVQGVRIVMDDVVYHEGAVNLVSVVKLLEKGHQVIFKKSTGCGMEIRCVDGQILKFRENIMDIEESAETVCVARPVENLHVRLGHYPFDDKCRICLRTNLRRPDVRKKPREIPVMLAPFQRISIDLVEVQVPSFSGSTICITAVDNGTKYIFGHPIKSKNQAAEVVVSMLRDNVGVFRCSQLIYGLRVIRTDRGGEFRDLFTREVARLGYLHRFSAPYVHEINGAVERQNSLLLATVRALLFAAFYDEEREDWISGLCLKLWAEALKVACALMNMRRRKSNKGLSPCEMLTPDIDWNAALEGPTFGQPCWVHVTAEERIRNRVAPKLVPRGVPGLWMGYDSLRETQTHRVFGAGAIIQVSRNVKFPVMEPEESWDHKKRVFKHVENFLSASDETERSKGRLEKTKTQVVGFKRPRGRPPKVPKLRLPELSQNLETLFDEGELEIDEDQTDEDQVVETEDVKDVNAQENDVDAVEEQEIGDSEHGQTVNEELVGIEANVGDVGDGSDAGDSGEAGSVDLESEIEFEPKVKRRRHCVNVVLDERTRRDPGWVKAIAEEWRALIDSGAVTQADDEDKKRGLQVIPSILLLDLKPEGRKKARIVALGNLRTEDVYDGSESFYSPVVSRAALKVLFAFWSSKLGGDLHVTALDVPTAFLRSKPIDGEFRECLLMPPKDVVELGLVAPSQLFRTKGCIYGMREAPLLWNKTLEREFISLGLTQSVMEPNVYCTPNVAAASHVDDIIIVGEVDEANELAKNLKEIFNCKQASGVAFKFVDLELDNTGKRLWMYQREFTKKVLMNAQMLECNGSKTLPEGKFLERTQEGEASLSVGDREMLERTVGELTYLSTCSRPDIMFVALKLSMNLKNPCDRHLIALKRTLRFLKQTENAGIGFDKLKHEEMVVKVYSDSNFGKETFGGCIILVNESVVHWRCQRFKIPTCSTTEAEYLASAMALREGEWICNMLQEMGKSVVKKSLFVDNMAVTKILKQEKSRAAVRHTELAQQFCIYHLGKSWKVCRVSSEANPADLLTKTLGGVRHRELAQRIGLVL